MSVDKAADRPKWKQVADFVRDLVANSEPGDPLPSARALSQQFRVGLDTAQQAMQELNHEGLISTDRARGGSWVREKPRPDDLQVVRPPRGARVSTRMPSEPERQQYGLEVGVPLLVVDRGPGYEPRVKDYPSSQFIVVIEVDPPAE